MLSGSKEKEAENKEKNSSNTKKLLEAIGAAGKGRNKRIGWSVLCEEQGMEIMEPWKEEHDEA